MLPLSTPVKIPNLTSVTAPWAFPSAEVTIVRAVPGTVFELSSSPSLAIVNVVAVGTLNTSVFSSYVESSGTNT